MRARRLLTGSVSLVELAIGAFVLIAGVASSAGGARSDDMLLPCGERAPDRAGDVPLAAEPLDAERDGERDRGGSHHAEEPAGNVGRAQHHNQDGADGNPK